MMGDKDSNQNVNFQDRCLKVTLIFILQTII